jgi:poly-gamma-glutamate synthesis protein (capsule biosynthesis protein)
MRSSRPLLRLCGLLALGLAHVAPAPGRAGSDGAPEPRVRLVMAGDIMLDTLPGETIAGGGDPFAPFAAILDDADLVVGNLECAVATGGEKVPKPYNFRAHPRVVPVLARYFDAVSLANNHTGDFGPDALMETLGHLARGGVRPFGAGRNVAEAHAPLILEKNGLRIALLGYDEFIPRSFAAGAETPGVAWSLDAERRVLADIRAARALHRADVVIPFLHWGWEDEPEPNARQRAFARAMIDAGADCVVGGHPHVTQGSDTYRGRPIVYSLGNFVFDEYEGRTGWVLRLTLGRRGVESWDTVVARTDARGTPHPVPDAASPRGRADAPARGDTHPR